MNALSASERVPVLVIAGDHDVAARLLEQQQVLLDKQLLSVRAQLLDLQSASNEKALIRKLYRHIIQLQMSEGRSSPIPTPTPTVVW